VTWAIVFLALILLGLAVAGYILFVAINMQLKYLEKRVETLERVTDELVNEEK